uniref:Uncharacterized protein n=1 Tax=Picea glauca TaxID=3330 RepID=A0A117NHI3_PICGL|nr:hypothetical protein ABT39_MTgene5397 [Picea glauca]
MGGLCKDLALALTYFLAQDTTTTFSLAGPGIIYTAIYLLIALTLVSSASPLEPPHQGEHLYTPNPFIYYLFGGVRSSYSFITYLEGLDILLDRLGAR